MNDANTSKWVQYKQGDDGMRGDEVPGEVVFGGWTNLKWTYVLPSALLSRSGARQRVPSRSVHTWTITNVRVTMIEYIRKNGGDQCVNKYYSSLVDLASIN